MENRYRIVQRTTDYSIFKTLKGNRDVGKSRVSVIVDSIKKVGYIMNPIIVNEELEVIDGQGRLSALQELGLPVYYLIVPNTGITECISMNINQEKWTSSDYIKSYAERGNREYILLQRALDIYYPGVPKDIIKIAMSGHNPSSRRKAVENGEFVVERGDWESVLEYLNKYARFRRGFSGSWPIFMKIMLWAYDSSYVDRNVMFDQFKKYWGAVGNKSVSNTKDMLESVEDMYNYRRRKKVYLKQHYDEYIRNLSGGASGGLKHRNGTVQWDSL